MSNTAKKIETNEEVEAVTADVVEMAPIEEKPLKDTVRAAVSTFQRCFTNFDNSADKVIELQGQIAELSKEMTDLIANPEKETEERDVAMVAAERKRDTQSLKNCAPEKTNGVLNEAIEALEAQIALIKSKMEG